MMPHSFRSLSHVALQCGVLLFALAAHAEDWPTFMHDRARSGVSGETLAFPLNATWSYTPPAEPVHAWPSPQAGYNELPKLAFEIGRAHV